MFGPLAWLIWGIQERKSLKNTEAEEARSSSREEAPTERLKQVLDEATWVVADERNQLYVLPSTEQLLTSDPHPDGADLVKTSTSGEAQFKRYFSPISKEAETEHAVLVADPAKIYRSFSSKDSCLKSSAEKHSRSLSENNCTQDKDECVSSIDEDQFYSNLSPSREGQPFASNRKWRSNSHQSSDSKFYHGSGITTSPDSYLSPDSLSQDSFSLFGSQTSMDLVSPKPEIINEEVHVANIASQGQNAIPDFERSIKSDDADILKARAFGSSFQSVKRGIPPGDDKKQSNLTSANSSKMIPFGTLNSQENGEPSSLISLVDRSNDTMGSLELTSATADEDHEIHSAFASIHPGAHIRDNFDNKSKIDSIDFKPEQGATRMSIKSPIVRIKTSNARPVNPVHVLSIHQDDNNDNDAPVIINTQREEHYFEGEHTHEQFREPKIKREAINQDCVDNRLVSAPAVDVELINSESNVNYKPRESKVTLRKTPTQLVHSVHSVEKHTAKLSDFDKIMQRRKKFTDSMHNAGSIIGQIAHRDDTIEGRAKSLSPNWLKIKDCVKLKKYLEYESYINDLLI